MSKRILLLALVAMLAIGLMAAPALAQAPADGECVVAGVGALGYETVAAAAQGGLVDDVILSHLFTPEEWEWCG